MALSMEQQLAVMLERAVTALNTKAAAATYAGGQKALQLADERIPVDTSHLKNSRYVSVNYDQDAHSVSRKLGYSADYAALVHEYPQSTNWSKPWAEAQWFDNSNKRNKQKILTTIAGAMQL